MSVMQQQGMTGAGAGRAVLLALALSVVAACSSGPKPRPGAVSAPAPGVKIGKPYQVMGKTYVPHDDRRYDERGIASWYGPDFHAKPTANGEIYNQNDVTAAHKTLPMPSWVEVSNLDNGRQLVVRINDRGPFVDGRIIDLSRRSAQLLGVDRVGLARVRVKRIFPEGDWARTTPGPDGRLPGGKAAEVRTASVPPPVVQPLPEPQPVAPYRPVAEMPVVTETTIPPSDLRGADSSSVAAQYIQVAALSDAARAAALSSVVGDFGPSAVSAAPGGLWRVRVGPLRGDRVADVLGRLQAAGYRDARIVR